MFEVLSLLIFLSIFPSIFQISPNCSDQQAESQDEDCGGGLLSWGAGQHLRDDHDPGEGERRED